MRHNLQSLFGLELSTAQKVIVASVVILVLLVLLGLFVRQIQGGRLRLKGQGGGRARQPRLGVVDAHNLDRQRQLILIRRDNVEHLIMIGGASDVVVETNIMRSGGRVAPQPIDYGATERPQALEGLLSPELVRQDAPRQESARSEVVRQDPVAVVQPRPEQLPPLPSRPVQPPAPARPPQADAAMAAAAVAGPVVVAMAAEALAPKPEAAPIPSVQPPSFARDHAPSPAASAVELDSMARQLEEALKRPFSAVRPANSPGEAPATAKPSAVSEVATAEPISVDPASPVEPPSAPLVVEAETVGRSISLPADVEAELEMALGLRPERVAPLPPEPVQPEVAPVHQVVADTVDAADEELLATEAESHPLPADPDAEEPAAAETDVELKGEEDAPEPLAPAAAPEPVVAEPEQKPAAIDPFSVDAIEAEFARLLGRDPKPGA